jgi:hypothetical protein
LLTKNYIDSSDEGTHAIIGLFYKDLIFNLKNFHSINEIVTFAINYLVKYPKISIYYPPLYHSLLAITFIIQENVLTIRVLNIVLTILASYTIFKLSHEFFENEKLSFLSALFFLSFSIIFYYADKVMIDIAQILTFSLALWYYVKLKKSKKIDIKNIVVLSLLISLSFLTKFYSIFLPIIILIDSFISDKKFFKNMIFCLILSGLIVSPYAFFYYKFNLFKLTLDKSTSTFANNLVYFDIFSNFGIFLGFFVVFSLIYFFYKNRRNYIFFIWFFIPLLLLLYLKNDDVRFSFILMPIYSISCGFTFINMKKWFKSKKLGNVLTILVLFLLLLQLIDNIYLNSKGGLYSVDDIMKQIRKDGNVLILSEYPVYSSAFIFYGRLNNIQGNIIRPCIFWENNLTKELLNEWGVRYIIDQKNNINNELIDKFKLNLIWEKKVNDNNLRLFEIEGNVNKVDCNFVCIFNGKVCKNQNFSDIKSMINRNVYITK